MTSKSLTVLNLIFINILFIISGYAQSNVSNENDATKALLKERIEGFIKIYYKDNPSIYADYFVDDAVYYDDGKRFDGASDIAKFLKTIQGLNIVVPPEFIHIEEVNGNYVVIYKMKYEGFPTWEALELWTPIDGEYKIAYAKWDPMKSEMPEPPQGITIRFILFSLGFGLFFFLLYAVLKNASKSRSR